MRVRSFFNSSQLLLFSKKRHFPRDVARELAVQVFTQVVFELTNAWNLWKKVYLGERLKIRFQWLKLASIQPRMSILNFGKISYQQPPALIIKHVPRLRAPSLRSNPITFPRKSWPRQRQRSTYIQAAANLSCTAYCSFTDRSFRIGFHSWIC